MGVACQILINTPREGVHKAGQPVTGSVKCAIDEPTEYRDVTLSFLGQGRCKWSESTGNSSTTYYGSENYITRHVNITNKSPNKTITLLHGVHEYPFEFYLPEDIPTSYKSTIGSITYRIQLTFVKPNFFSFNTVFTKEIPVYGSVDLSTRDDTIRTDGPVIFGLEKTLFALFAAKKPVVNLKAEIAKTCLTPGENAHLSYTVTNHADVAISSVRTGLYCYITYTSDCAHVNRMQMRMKRCETETGGVPERQVRSFTCVLPTLPEMYSIQHSKVISLEYRVRVTVQLPAPHFDAMVEVPIVLGERKGSVEPCLEVFEDMDQGASAPPPSYWEAMAEQKA